MTELSYTSGPHDVAPGSRDGRASPRYRTVLTFHVSSYLLLTHIEREFTYHRDIDTETGFDDAAFNLHVECDDTALAAWEVRVVVLTFDPGSSLHRRSHLVRDSRATPAVARQSSRGTVRQSRSTGIT